MDFGYAGRLRINCRHVAHMTGVRVHWAANVIAGLDGKMILKLGTLLQ